MKFNSSLKLSPQTFSYLLFNLSSRASLIIILLNLLASFTEGIGFAMLLPILNLSGISNQLITNKSTPIFSDFLPSSLPLEMILCLFSAMLCIFAILSYYRTILVNRVEWQITCLEQEKLFSSIAKAKWAEILTQRKSDLIELLMREARQVGFAYVQCTSMLSAFLSFILLTLMACFISASATLLSLSLGIFIILITRPLNKQVYKSGKESYTAYQDLYAQCDSHLDCLPLIKMFNSTSHHIEHFTLACNQLSTINKNFISARAKTALLYRFSVALCLGLSAYFSITFNFLTVSEFIVLSALFSRIVPQLLVLHHGYQTFLNCIPSYLALSDSINYFHKNAESEPINASNSKPKMHYDLSKGIRFENISYHYPHTESKLVLDDISINLVPTGIVSISGPSGSGKSTFACILAGLLAPTKGNIRIGNHILDNANLLQWRKNIGYVPQETVLPYSTIRQSLLIAKPNATDSELWNILEIVSLRELVENLPLKLEGYLGDGGCLLSGGERQRLAIARAMLNNPRILILDEATNALDKETEKIIFAVLERHKADTLIVIISHQEINALPVDLRLILSFQNLRVEIRN